MKKYQIVTAAALACSLEVVAPNSGAISAAQHTYFTNASAIWAGVAALTVAGAVIVTCRRADKRA